MSVYEYVPIKAKPTVEESEILGPGLACSLSLDFPSNNAEICPANWGKNENSRTVKMKQNFKIKIPSRGNLRRPER